MTDAYLTEIGDVNFEMRQTYLQSLKKVWDEPVELFLGNHCVDNQLLERREKETSRQGIGNPYLDATAWKSYLQGKRLELLRAYPKTQEIL